MSVGTSIEWTHIPGTVPATMNALVGCRKVSAGCKNCYAIGVAHVRAGNPLPVMQEKFGGTTERTGAGLNWTGKVTLSEKALLEPLTKRKPHTYFVNSMSDLFYEGAPDEWIDRHYAVFALCPQHTFIVLTKRPERMQKYLSDPELPRRVRLQMVRVQEQALMPLTARRKNMPRIVAWANQPAPQLTLPLPNVWHLVSVEDQPSADKRIPLLLQTPSAVRGVSCEPLLGDLDLRGLPCTLPTEIARGCYDALDGNWWPALGDSAAEYAGKRTELPKLDWVICGGESGAGARPMHPDWARGLRDQCQAAGVPYFFKQWGEWTPGVNVERNTGVVTVANLGVGARWFFADEDLANDEGHIDDEPDLYRVGKKAAGHLLDGRVWHQFPEVRG